MSVLAGLCSARPAALRKAVVTGLLACAGSATDGSYHWADADRCTLAALAPLELAQVDGAAPLLLACDARLDDTAQLRRTLEAQGDDPAHLILSAWRRWGAGAPGRILGEFAFALWDGREQRLTMVRDALGFRPLFFVARAGEVAFASRADAFAALDPRHGRPDGESLRRHLVFAPDPRRSFYDGVEQVAPGEIVTVDARGVYRERWWRPSTTAVRRSSADMVADCRSHLQRAVQRGLDGECSVVATHLSAGLDSAAVTAFAANQRTPGVRLIAITGAPAHVPAGERRLADERANAAVAAAALAGVEHRVAVGAGDPLAPLHGAAGLFQQPLPSPHNFGWLARGYDIARAEDAGTLLIGQLGNYSFSMAGDPWRVWKERLRRLRPTGGQAALFPLLSRPAKAAQVELERPPSGGAERRLHLLRTINPGAYLGGVRSAWGLNLRDPFADRELVEFSLTLGEGPLAAHGARWLPRAVLAGVLPADFLAERRRGYQSADWIVRLAARRDAVRQEIARAREFPLLHDLLDFDAMDAACERLSSDVPPGSDAESLLRVDLPWALSTAAFVRDLACNG